MYFGVFYVQIIFYIGILYNGKDFKVKLFCIVFESMDYSLVVVWVYFSFVFDEMQRENELFEILYIFSDGLVIQYK